MIKIANFSFSPKVLTFLGLLLVSILSIFYLLTRTKKTTLPAEIVTIRNQIPENSQSKVQNVEPKKIILSPDFALPVLPAEFTIYKASVASNNVLGLTQKLAAKFSLTAIPDVKNYWTNKDQSEVIYIDAQQSSIHYSKNTNTDSQKTQPINSQKAVELAKKYLQQFPDWKDFISESEQTIFYNNDGDITVTSEDQADLISVPFSPSLDTFPLRVDSQTKAFISILVDRNYQVVGFTVYPQSFTIQEPKFKLSSLTPERILYLVQNGAGKISRISTEFPVISLPTTFDEITITKASIEYRIDSKNQQTIPYLSFYGSAQDPMAGKTTLTIILPIVSL